MGDFVWASDNARNWEEEEDQQEQYLELMYMHQLYNGIIQNQQYVLRGSKLSCSYGTSYSLLDTAQDHGIYKEDLAVLTTIDSGKSNICDFGSCLCPESNYVGRLPMTVGTRDGKAAIKVSGNDYAHICVPMVPEDSAWGQVDSNVLAKTCAKGYVPLLLDNAALVCQYGGIIRIEEVAKVTSGQEIKNKKVYITADRKAIVINDIHYEIYNPTIKLNDSIPGQPEIRAVENWYTLWDYTVSEREFDWAKAILGHTFEWEDLARSEIVIDTNGTMTYGNGNTVPDYQSFTVISANLPAGTTLANQLAIGYAITIAVNVLQCLANAIEYTYVTFYFQKSNLGKHRVVILGGTKSNVQNFKNYQYYNKWRSFLDHVVHRDTRSWTQYRIQPSMKQWVSMLIKMIADEDPRVKLLVPYAELLFREGRYYDLGVKLNPVRRGKKYQVYLYPDNKEMCQKIITYPGESLVVSGRMDSFLNHYNVKLIDFIDLTVTTKGNSKFWDIFEQFLQKDENIPVANDSNATKVTLKDVFEEKPTEISEEMPIQSIHDLININA